MLKSIDKGHYVVFLMELSEEKKAIAPLRRFMRRAGQKYAALHISTYRM
ncbi:MAG: hypothetical protein KME08_14690 [Aphanothece sp. CMT-3BRIN-NPC111]|nr:hypothetical protein [Aphanothece sp. CMT-3BRIN-NPC111]